MSFSQHLVWVYGRNTDPNPMCCQLLLGLSIFLLPGKITHFSVGSGAWLPWSKMSSIFWMITITKNRQTLKVIGICRKEKIRKLKNYLYREKHPWMRLHEHHFWSWYWILLPTTGFSECSQIQWLRRRN